MVGNERRKALAPGILGFRHAVERNVAIVARERGHARIGNRGVLLHEASVGKRLMQGEPVERVAMQVENIRRCGFKWHNRSPLLDAAERAGRCSVRRSTLGTPHRCVRSIIGHDSPVFQHGELFQSNEPSSAPNPHSPPKTGALSRFSLFWHKFAVVNDGGCLRKGFPHPDNSATWGYAFS